MTGLEKLRALTQNLSPVPFATLVERDRDNIVEYRGEGGTFIGFGLYKIAKVAIQRAFISKGTVIPKHKHKEKEWILTYSGNYILKLNGEERECPVGTMVFLDENQMHSAVMLEDTWRISITIPASEAYANA